LLKSFCFLENKNLCLKPLKMNFYVFIELDQFMNYEEIILILKINICINLG